MEQFVSNEEFSFNSGEASQGSVKKRGYQKRTSTKGGKTLGSQYADTKTSQKWQRKRLAGIKSRQRKKNYVKFLQENITRLSEELTKTENKLSQTKDNLVDALRNANSNTNEHAYTFAELEKYSQADYPDLDRINLLIDLIRNRIGANGKERFAKLDYNFKQVVNSMFPASFRYLLNNAEQSTDIFEPNASTHSLTSNPQHWTSQIYQSTAISSQQIKKIGMYQHKFKSARAIALQYSRRLRQIQEKIRDHGEIFQKRLGDFREDLNPLQCAKFMLFAQKNKFRRQFGLSTTFEDEEQVQNT